MSVLTGLLLLACVFGFAHWLITDAGKVDVDAEDGNSD